MNQEHPGVSSREYALDADDADDADEQPPSPLTVGELRELLARFSAGLPVILSADAEGNRHSPLADVVERMYPAESSWSGEVYLTAEQLAAAVEERPHQGWDLEDDAAPADSVRAVVLGPVN